MVSLPSAFESAAERLAMLVACGGVAGVIRTAAYGQFPFGEAPFGGEGTVTGIFDRDYVDVDGIESSVPVFICRTEDVASVSHGSRLTVDSTAFKVVEIQPDGSGITTLFLDLTS